MVYYNTTLYWGNEYGKSGNLYIFHFFEPLNMLNGDFEMHF